VEKSYSCRTHSASGGVRIQRKEYPKLTRGPKGKRGDLSRILERGVQAENYLLDVKEETK